MEVARRVLTNGSIYIEQAHLTNGQQLLLEPARRASCPRASPSTPRRSLRACATPSAPDTPLVPAGWPEDPVPAAAAQVVHDDGHRMLPRLIRYIEERRANERRFTGAIETDPSPLHVVWGLDDPDRRPVHGRHAAGGPPRCDGRASRQASATTRWSKHRSAFSTRCFPVSS